ncbi:hypothetical protein, partial [Pseudomonas sp. UBA6323]
DVGLKELLEFILENHPANINTITTQRPLITQRSIECWLKLLREKGLAEFKGAQSGRLCVIGD